VALAAISGHTMAGTPIEGVCIMSSLAKLTQAWRTGGATPGPGLEQRRLRLALAVLAIALFVVVLRDIREFRPPVPVSVEPAVVAQTDSSQSTAAQAPVEVPADIAHSAPVQPRTHSKPKHARVKRPVINAAQAVSSNELSAGPSIVATDRAVLPPLQVEVVAGNHHKALVSHSNSVKVDMQSGYSPDAGQAASTSAAPETPQPAIAAQVSVSPDVAAHVAHSVAPSYPLLAKQMKVQGAVVLQALIDKGGKIQNLRVLSGPTILAAAAEEAVKQWRFKPYYQGGAPVETEARVSVNFTISTF
jgi:TonB family protein